jgi:colicin import membrane protein
MEPLITLWESDSEWRTNQVDEGLKYIKERYGSPANALKFRNANKWY